MDPSQPKMCGFAPVQEDAAPDRSFRTKGPWRALAAALPALLLLAMALVHGPQAGSLDDAFVVWSDARAVLVPPSPPEFLGDLGGWPAVEGSTSLLDVGLKALVLRAAPGLDPLRTAGWMGLGWLLLLLAVVVRMAVRWTESWVLAGLIASLLVLSPGLVESAGYLLEGPLFALLWTLALVAAVEARPRLCALACVLLAAARPEGLLLAPVLVGWAAHRRRSRTAAPVTIGWPWRWVGLGLGCSLLVTLLRWLRFREIVPNTYYAKASDSLLREVLDGLGYLRAVLWGPADQVGPSLPALGLSLSLAWVATWTWRRTREVIPSSVRGASRGLLALSALYAAVVVASGGDSYEGARLFMPVALPVWLGLATSLARRVKGGPSETESAAANRPSLLVCLSLLLAIAGLLPASLAAGGSVPWQRPSGFVSSTLGALAKGPVGLEAFEGDAETFRAVALALAPDGVFAHVHTQRFRWLEPGTPVLDLTGLTDRRIARLPAQGSVRFGRFALDEALRQQATAIHLDPQRARPTSIVDAPSLIAALSDPSVAGRYVGEPFVAEELARALAQEYVGASRALPHGQGYFNLLVRRSHAEAFRREGFRVAP